MDKQPSILETGLDLVKARVAELPPEKNGALIVTAEVKYGVPVLRFGVATRNGEHFQLGAEAETSFKKASTSAKVYAAWTW